MANLQETFTDIANAIREKEGTAEPINAQDFASRIRGLSGGGLGRLTLGNCIKLLPKESTTTFTDKSFILFYTYNTNGNVKYVRLYKNDVLVKTFTDVYNTNQLIIYNANQGQLIYWDKLGVITDSDYVNPVEYEEYEVDKVEIEIGYGYTLGGIICIEE